jgi:hypothetical protein
MNVAVDYADLVAIALFIKREAPGGPRWPSASRSVDWSEFMPRSK